MKIILLFPAVLAAFFSPALADSANDLNSPALPSNRTNARPGSAVKSSADSSVTKPSVEEAIAILKAENEEFDRLGVISRTKVQESVDKFFSSVNVSALTPQQIAEVFRQTAFFRADRKWAREAMDTLHASGADRGTTGVLSLALQGLMFGLVQGSAQERVQAGATLREHPAFTEALNGDDGDLVLAAACKGLPAPGSERNDALASVCTKLDVSWPGPAAQSVQAAWEAFSGQKEKPAPAQLTRVRKHLVAYLDAALKNSTHPRVVRWKDKIASTRDFLNGPAARGQLVGFPAPELHFLWTNLPELKALSQLKGKVVVLDFWAVWCQPCRAAFPEMRQLQERYRNYDVTLLGVTSLQNFMLDEKDASIRCDGDPEKETRLLAEFIKHKNITWPVVVSREPVFNPDYGINGIPAVAIIAPDGVLKFLLTTGRESTEEKIKMIDSLLAEFGKPTPKA
ncbi:MAG: TlpA disulfide reductase family protein [Nibricoccus sp.]